MRELAIIKGIKFGLRNMGKPVLWFGEKHLDGGSLQIIEMNEIEEFLKKADCYDINDLEGKPIIIEHNGPGSICRVVDFFK